MYKGILGNKEWQSVGLRKNGDRAILWGREIMWLTAWEFETLLISEERIASGALPVVEA
jgi:hypothetical protein